MRYKFFGVVVALTFLLVSCSKNDNKKSDISSDKPKVSDTKNISTEMNIRQLIFLKISNY